MTPADVGIAISALTLVITAMRLVAQMGRLVERLDSLKESVDDLRGAMADEATHRAESDAELHRRIDSLFQPRGRVGG